jgi:sulfate adenylyltransferase subunit 1
MDLQDYSEEIFNRIKDDFKSFSDRIFPGKDVHFIPISALRGDNVVDPSINMDWYKDETLLQALENIPISNDYNLRDGRFPVQFIIRPESDEFHDYRGYAGRIAGGIFHKGDRVMVLPSRIPSLITSINTFNDTPEEAFPPMSVTLTLADDIDISRGDMIVPENNLPLESTTIEVMLCWMNIRPLLVNGKYAIKHTTRDVRCIVREVKYILNINTLEKEEKEKEVKLNDIACVVIQTTKPLFYDP